MPPGSAPTRWLVSSLCCRFLKLEVQAYRSVHQTVQPSLFKIARSFTKVIIILLVSFEIHLMIPIWLRLHLSYSDSSSLTPITSPLSRGRAELLGINTTEPDPISPRARSMRFTSYRFFAGVYLKNCNKIGICLGNKRYFLLSDSDSNSAVCGLYQYAPSNSHCQNRFVSFLGMVLELTGIAVDTGSIYFVQVSYRILHTCMTLWHVTWSTLASPLLSPSPPEPCTGKKKRVWNIASSGTPATFNDDCMIAKRKKAGQKSIWMQSLYS